MMKTWALVAVAAMGLTACQNDYEEQIEAKDKVVVSFLADAAEGRTSVNTEGEAPVFAWDDAESFAVLEQTDKLAVATDVNFSKKENGSAEITAAFDYYEYAEGYKYVAVYPETGYVSGDFAEATLTLPAEQTMVAGSYDPAADLMVSKVVATDVQPTEIQPLRFTRLAAVAKMSFRGIADGEKVESVTFTAEGKTIAGNLTASLEKPYEFTVAEDGSNSVTVKAVGEDAVYFTLLPTTLEVGDTYTVAVATDKYLYVKEGTIADKALEFAAGMVTRFGVDLTDIAPSDKWVLVKDASTLKQGDIVTIAAKDYDKAISKNLYNNADETSTKAQRASVDITKHGDYLVANSDVQPFILVSGSVDGTFSFYDEARGKFLVSNNKTSRYLINQSYIDANTSFAITIDATDYDAVIKNTVGDFKDCMIKYYLSYKYFYSGTSTTNKDVCLYRIEGAVGTIPTVAANVTVPTANVVIAEDGTNTATPIEEVVFNYVGDWTISVSTDADWLNVSYAEGKVSYTSEQNIGEKREATVTIKATLEGQEALTWDFKVLQKSAALDITIAEFVDLDKDENSTYRLTGKIVTAATNATSSGYYLADENDNQVKINYLDTEDGENVWGHEDITLVVGDIVTVTTVPVGSKTGGNSSHPSIYKGHYGIKASAGLAAEYTGGEVTIEVEVYSNGNVVAPTEIVGTMAENDFAEFSYSGGNTATVTFTSENTTSYAREAEVTFTCGLASATAVAQQGINPANKLGYELVTDASTLAVGDEIIIVAKDSEMALGVYTGTKAITGISSFPGVEIAKSGKVIYDAVEAGVQTFTLAEVEAVGKFALQFTHKGNNYYLYAGSTVKGYDSLGNYTTYSISIDSTTGVALIKNSAGTPYFLSYKAASLTFGAVKTTADNTVAIYRMQK